MDVSPVAEASKFMTGIILMAIGDYKSEIPIWLLFTGQEHALAARFVRICLGDIVIKCNLEMAGLKIQSIDIQNFMAFNSLNINFSPQINIIFGENGTGKSALLKVMYAIMKSIAEAKNGKTEITSEKAESMMLNKLAGVFMPENDSVGRLVSRQQGSNRADIRLKLSNDEVLSMGFGNRQTKHMDFDMNAEMKIDDFVPVFIPPKEIISSTSNFTSLYDDYHIAIDETYYDLARLLMRPLKKGSNTKEQNNVLAEFSKIMNGNVLQKDNKFYLKVQGAGEFEMGLVSEGYRKLSTLTYLILSGSLNKNAILFWDEPETNMNPKLISHVTDALIKLAQMGVQIFISTHSYFVQQSFNLFAEYQNKGKEKIHIQFMSLHKEQEFGKLHCEISDSLSEITHNAIMEEFDAIYDKEQELI